VLETVHSELVAIDEVIEEAADDTDNEVIESDVSGRVKQVYAGEGDNVQNAIVEHGSLLLLSVDGKMNLSFQTRGDTIVKMGNKERQCMMMRM
jgi:hypothetical protein